MQMSPLEKICMKCQIQFSRKNKKNLINLLSAESVHSMVIDNSQMSVQKKQQLTTYADQNMQMCSLI